MKEEKRTGFGKMSSSERIEKTAERLNLMLGEVNEKQKRRVLDCGGSNTGTFLKAFTKRASALGAIKAKCLDCTNEQPIEITECPVTVCPLWKYRPYVSHSSGCQE